MVLSTVSIILRTLVIRTSEGRQRSRTSRDHFTLEVRSVGDKLTLPSSNLIEVTTKAENLTGGITVPKLDGRTDRIAS